MLGTSNDFGGALILEKWEGVNNIVSPFGCKFIATGGELFDHIVNKLHFQKVLEAYLNFEPHEMLRQSQIDELNQIKELIKLGKIKVSITIEVESDLNKLEK